MKLGLCNTGLRKPLSTRHTTTGPHSYTHMNSSDSDSLSYISPANPIPAQQRPPMEVTQLYSDPRHNPSCTRVKQPNPTIHSAVYPLLTLPWHNTMYILETRATNQLLAVRACLLLLSLPLQDSRPSGPKPSLSHKALLFCSPCFLDEMV